MATYHVETDNGTYEVEVADQQAPNDFGAVAKSAADTALRGPYTGTKAMLDNPQQLGEHLPVMGAVMGEAVGGPLGAAAGAGLGQIGKRMAGIAYGTQPPSEGPLKEAIGPMVQAAVAGAPGTTEGQAITGAIGKGLAKVGQAFSGAKATDLTKAAQKGYSTYAAPNMENASAQFGSALEKSGINTTPSLEATLDPQLGFARTVAMKAGEKLDQGLALNGQEALQARQAVDRVIAGTPAKDKPTLLALGNLRQKFNQVLNERSPEVGAASRTYADAILKNNLTKPMPVNKGGEYSKLAPYLAAAAGSALGVKGHNAGEGILAGGGYLLGTSPLAMGVAATTIGAISPTMRQALLSEFIDRIVTKNNQ